VLELGAGHGLNFLHYPNAVSKVIAVEPEPTLRVQATSAAANVAISIRVVGGAADQLPLEDESVDAAVTSLVLCAIPDQDHALAELHRVIRPRGELRFYEHVIPNCQPKRLLLQAADYSGVWPHLAGGCHPARDTTTAMPAPVSRSKRSSGSCSPPLAWSRPSRTSLEPRAGADLQPAPILPGAGLPFL
jgi:ubiquinone/menaquinone biosynthesis C-methylase UbiE